MSILRNLSNCFDKLVCTIKSTVQSTDTNAANIDQQPSHQDKPYTLPRTKGTKSSTSTLIIIPRSYWFLGHWQTLTGPWPYFPVLGRPLFVLQIHESIRCHPKSALDQIHQPWKYKFISLIHQLIIMFKLLIYPCLF